MLITTFQRTDINVETMAYSKNKSRIVIPNDYLFNIYNKQVYNIYSLVSIIYHDGNSMSTGHYYSDILEFNTGVWWQFNDDSMTQI